MEAVDLDLEVDPQRPVTWRNHPRPASFPEFERELLALGGTHANGRPNFRLAWCPERKKMRLGKLRHIYLDTRIPTRKHVEQITYFVKDLADPAAEYRAITADEFNAMTGEEAVRYFYYPAFEIVVETQAVQRFAVEQYFPPERLGDTPEAWQRRRFRHFTPPETNEEVFGDDTGPWPSEGEYRVLFFIQSPALTPIFDVAGAYREPDAGVLSLMREAVARRERHKRTVSREREVENVYADHEAAELKQREETDELLKKELKHFERKNTY